MTEAQTFEMLPLPRMTPQQKRVFPGLVLYVILMPLSDWILTGFAWSQLVPLVLIALVFLERAQLRRRPPKTLQLTSHQAHLPLGWRKNTVIPLASVEEVSITTKGLIIAWKKNGVPRYTELSEHWFAEPEWVKVQSALMAWGNRTRCHAL
jgi:hypothetical protein